jgi:hypothetical protein
MGIEHFQADPYYKICWLKKNLKQPASASGPNRLATSDCRLSVQRSYRTELQAAAARWLAAKLHQRL